MAKQSSFPCPCRSEKENAASPLVKCDLCGRPFEEANFMIDGAVCKDGPWGCLCAACFLSQNGELGWGKGQLYKRTPKAWKLVAGGPPEDSQD